MVAWNSVPHEEAARAPHDVSAIRGRLEFQIHCIRRSMQASALDLKGTITIVLSLWYGFKAQNTRLHENMLLM